MAIKGSTGMTLVNTHNDDTTFQLPALIDFDFPYIRSGSSLTTRTFYASGNDWIGIGSTSEDLTVARNDSSYNNLYHSLDVPGQQYRIRWEGQYSYGDWGSNNIVWEATFFNTGRIELAIETMGQSSKNVVFNLAGGASLPAIAGHTYVFYPNNGQYICYDDNAVKATAINFTQSSYDVNTVSYQLSLNITPSNATPILQWTSSDTSIATVSSTGLVTPMSLGTTIITAATVDGSNLTASCTVNIQFIPVTSISITNPKGIVGIGKSFTFSYSVNPSTATNKTVNIYSSNPSVATVDSTGLVTGVGNGSCTIYAYSTDGSGKYKSFSLTVMQDPVESISLDRSSVNINIGMAVKINAIANPSTAANKTLSYSSSNTSIATVDPNGNITGVAAGNCYITISATDGSGTQAYCLATVSSAILPSSIYIVSPPRISFGDKYQLSVRGTPTDYTCKTYNWSSDNTNIVTVDQNGTITGVGNGAATITITTIDGSNLTASCSARCTKYVKSITLNNTSLNLVSPGSSTGQLTATVLPSDAGDTSVTWDSSDTSVATVNSNGLVTGVGGGSCTITCSANDGSGITASCNINVIVYVSNITLPNIALLDWFNNQTNSISAVVTPYGATNKTLNWTSSDNNIVNVDNNGNLTGVGNGTATITATAADGSGISGSCIVYVMNIVGKAKANPANGIILGQILNNLPLGILISENLKQNVGGGGPYIGTFPIPTDLTHIDFYGIAKPYNDDEDSRIGKNPESYSEIGLKYNGNIYPTLFVTKQDGKYYFYYKFYYEGETSYISSYPPYCAMEQFTPDSSGIIINMISSRRLDSNDKVNFIWQIDNTTDLPVIIAVVNEDTIPRVSMGKYSGKVAMVQRAT